MFTVHEMEQQQTESVKEVKEILTFDDYGYSLSVGIMAQTVYLFNGEKRNIKKPETSLLKQRWKSWLLFEKKFKKKT